ncbi:MAG: FKBP-type peptidyl-prolyl cis-trans isomerase [Caulobacteraceae bacterium]|nr:FKBP-type peptidyl-prolyl cis-trans isomerase [Caulobacteraceae bacterium]
MPMSRRLIVLACAAALVLPGAAFAQKSQSQLDWEATQATYLTDNLKKPGWKASADGVQFKRISKPNPKGKQPTAESEVEVRYVGKTVSDNQFDASPESETTSFGLGEVIEGWTKGIPMMREGETWSFAIPAALGYGDRAKPGIPAGSALLFDVTLVKVLTNPAAAPPPAAKPAAKQK